MGLYDRDHRQNDPWKNNHQNEKEFNNNKEKMTADEVRSYYAQIERLRNKNRKKTIKNQTEEPEKINKLIFAIPILILIIIKVIASKAIDENEIQTGQAQQIQTLQPQQQPQIINQVITRQPTPEEDQEYMKEHNLIKFGNEYHWCGIKESKDILPITKALDMNCQNDLCRITKYYDYVKQIPYEKGTEGKDKNAIDVMQEWKGDCDERSDLLASMMLANGYKVILLYTKDHTLTALNIPNYESTNFKSYVQYKGRYYYIAETTDPNGQIGAYNKEVMHNIKFIYDLNEKKVASSEEIHIQLYE